MPLIVLPIAAYLAIGLYKQRGGQFKNRLPERAAGIFLWPFIPTK